MSFKDKILKNQSPWGTPPGSDEGRGSPSGNGSGSRQDPPNLDDIIRNFQKTINKLSGGNPGGARPIIIGLIIISYLLINFSQKWYINICLFGLLSIIWSFFTGMIRFNYLRNVFYNK